MPVIKNIPYFIIFLVFASCPVMGQVATKKQLTEDDYKLWSTVEIATVSPKGGWVSYNLKYETNSDTLFVRNKTATKTFAFPKAYEGKFIGENWFTYMLPNKTLGLLNLSHGTIREIKEVKQYSFSTDGNTVITLTETGELTIEQIDGTNADKIEQVTGLYLNPNATAMIYTIAKEKKSLHYCSFGKTRQYTKIVSDAEAGFENIIWQNIGTAFAFIKQYPNPNDIRNGKSLYLYRLIDNKLFEFNINEHQNIDRTTTIVPPISTRFVISNDAKRVFFFLNENTNLTNEKPIVQIWNGNAPITYEQLQKSGDPKKMNRCAVWWPENGKFSQLTNTEQPNIIINGDQKYAITYSPLGEEPQFTFYSKSNWYVTNLESDKQNKLFENQEAILEECTTSYSGKYIAYRHGNDWFTYEFATGKHNNISALIPKKLYNETNDRAGIKPLFGIAGWTANDESLLLYDEYDLWEVNLAGMKAKRLTKGREQDIVFRLVLPYGKSDRNANFDGFTFPLISPEKGLYLSAYGKLSKKSGYYFWNGSEKALIFKDKAITNLSYAEGTETLYYIEEDFDSPPKIMTMHKTSGSASLVVNSNPQQSAYFWGTSKLISYTNSKGRQLQGALFYPANYDASKKYPMVVRIYENLSQHVHNYVKPTLHNGGVTNTSTLTSQGYFVLYPDIAYNLGEVGKSATDCVVQATKAVINMGLVIPDKIALFGHSFGGYEAAFIATQTNIFATIIIGAGVTDLVSSYLSIGWNNGRPEIWRYEHDQWRMNKPLYEDMENYLQNSPVMHANKVSVPILIWTGELDRQVHYYQSIEFYNALRRLGKKEVMLIYPENRHRLTTSSSQIDFTNKLKDWLTTFLKDEPAAAWISKGIE